MKRLSSLATLALLASAPVPAQDLYSQAVGSGQSLTITIKMRQATPNSTYTVGITGGSSISMTGPASVTTDVTGYAAVVLAAQGSANNSNPEAINVTLTDIGGSVSRGYLLQSRGGQLESAWPDFINGQGAFCNPTTAAATFLQVDRAADLDGDGLYGDVIIENAASGQDPIDYPGEFASDVNYTGTGCIGGVAPGVFLPGGGGRQVAFMADNRQVNGPCSFVTKLDRLEDFSFGMINGQPAVLTTNSRAAGSFEDQVFICRDANGDGSITDSEITLFFDPTVTINNENFSSDGVVVDPTATARAYWISDKSGLLGSPTNQGVFRLTDANGNNAIEASEVVSSWTGGTAVVMVEGNAVDTTEFECLHCDGSGAVYVNSTASGTIFRWADANGNGVAETGEVTNFLTYNNGGTAGWTVSADFSAGGSFPSISGTYFAMNLIESVTMAGSEVIFVASSNSSGNDAGYIFRCEDNNGDDDVNDLNEITVFVNPGAQVDPLGFPHNWSTGMDVIGIDANGNGTIEDAELYVYAANPNGPTPNCGSTQFNDLQYWRFNDGNGDGDANDTGENVRIAIHPTGAFHRTLELIPAGAFRNTFSARSTLQTVQAATCLTGAGEYLELDYLRGKIEEGNQGTPFWGNARFEMVSRGNSATGFGGLLIAAMQANPAIPLGSISACGLGVFGVPTIDLPSLAAPVNGELNFPFPLPVAAFSGTLYIQPYNLDFASGLVLGEVAQMDLN